MRTVVATLNLMSGRRVRELATGPQRLRAERGLDVLLVQENRPVAKGPQRSVELAVDSLCREWTWHTASVSTHWIDGLAVVFDAEHYELVDEEAFFLPEHTQLATWEALLLLDDRPRRVRAQRVMLRRSDGWPVVVVNVHLDTVGGNDHRARQMAMVADVVAPATQAGTPVVVGGDTNAFAFGHNRQLAALQRVVEPLERVGLEVVGDDTPTHYFARQHEPAWPHRVAVALGRLGIDLPGRFDMLASNVPCSARGVMHAPGSDHELVWMQLDETVDGLGS